MKARWGEQFSGSSSLCCSGLFCWGHRGDGCTRESAQGWVHKMGAQGELWAQEMRWGQELEPEIGGVQTARAEVKRQKRRRWLGFWNHPYPQESTQWEWEGRWEVAWRIEGLTLSLFNWFFSLEILAFLCLGWLCFRIVLLESTETHYNEISPSKFWMHLMKMVFTNV